MDKKIRLQGLTDLVSLATLMCMLFVPTAQAAEPVLPSTASVEGMNSVPRPTAPRREAAQHILVKLPANVDLPRLRARASQHGMHGLQRIYGSNWYTLTLPENANPRASLAIARRLPGVLMTTTDPIITLDAIPPGDPLYVDDDDPSTKSCDPVVDSCDAAELVDQWGLFKVEAESAWNVTTGSDDVVIAVLDSGMDLDHDDLIDNVWTNPADPADGIDNDGNGFIDDIHGADFVGDNLGDPLTDNIASQDADPDIPMGGTWVNDASAWPYGIRFDGDPAVGDAVDNNLDFFADLGVFHGTFVAAIIAAMTDNINPETGQPEGMAGACWNCKIMPVRMVNAEGNGYGSDAAAAIYYATDMGADVINLSWGFDLDNLDPAGLAEVAVITDAINHAVANGVIVVASAGNSGTPALRFPASMANTIAVGASNWLDQRSDFSTIAGLGEVPDNGIDDDGNGRIDDALDVVAPGEFIWSGYVYSAFESLQSQILGFPLVEPGTDAYASSNGTSFSAPLVAGYIGLLLSRFPDATPGEIREAVRNYAIDLLDPQGIGDNLTGYDAYSGFGRLRMHIPTSLSDPAPPPPPPPPPGPVITLSVDQVDTGEYGHNYGSNQHADKLIATFAGDANTPYRLQVTGYDIDTTGEVAVYLNGSLVGELQQGPENALNTGDLFSLDPAQLINGVNNLEFRQRTAGFTWGVNQLAVLGPPPVIALAIDTVDTGQYGYNYGSDEHQTSLFTTFTGDGVTPYYLQVTGYDIDYADEIAVYLNGALIGYLSPGANNDLNDGDLFTLEPGLLVNGENTLEFRQGVAGWTWGVTDLGILTTPPPGPPVIALTVDTVDTGQYGHNYGSDEHETSLFATFTGDGVTPYRLQVTGYDIDYADEIAVYLNDTLIGYLSPGANNGLNGDDLFTLEPGLLVNGENTLEFRQRVAGWTWGVTQLAVLGPPPVIALTVDTVDPGQYGHNYGSNAHQTSLFATFAGDGVTTHYLQVTGFDIDQDEEITVYLNGTSIGILSLGPDNDLNGGDLFSLDPALLVNGQNSVEFRQRVTGWTWGVTNLGILTSLPSNSPVIALTVGTVDPGQYGHNYGSSEHETALFATFTGDGVTPYHLQVTGYDIDAPDEIAVYLNGTLIGYLSPGANNGLNGGDLFSLDPALLFNGQNTLEFRQRVAGWKWGVTQLAVLGPPPVIALTVDTVDNGQYGHNFGSSEHQSSLFATFAGDGVTPYYLQVTGFDIDQDEEITVHLNGNTIGILSLGPDNSLNGGDLFTLDPALLVNGENTLEFRQRVAGWTWGVTNLGILTSLPTDSPVIALTVDTVDAGQYGHNYGSSEHQTSLFATFMGDGVMPHRLQVTGYDIDAPDEIAVYLNGTLIAYLSPGANNGLNGGDLFTLDPALLFNGQNTLEFRQRVTGWKWGVTQLAVLGPPPVIALTVGIFDTGEYGHNYGSSEHEISLFATFEGDGESTYELQVAGFDIDHADEIAVYLNDNSIGYLSPGPDNGLNAGDLFTLDPALLINGENTIEFRQRVPGWTWGVTNLGVFNLGSQ